MSGYWQELGFKGLVEKAETYKAERDRYLDDILAYREWFLHNEEKLKQIPVSRPPYTEENDEYLMKIIHAKYCPHAESE